MVGNFQEWLQQGDSLYQTAVKEYHAIEAQLDELESRLVAKQAEVNQIAQVMGKPPVEGSRRLSAQLVATEVIEAPDRVPAAGSNASIARALTGKFGR